MNFNNSYESITSALSTSGSSLEMSKLTDLTASTLSDLIIPQSKVNEDEAKYSPLRLRGPANLKLTEQVNQPEYEIETSAATIEHSPEDLFQESDRENEAETKLEPSNNSINININTSGCDNEYEAETRLYKSMKGLLSGVPPPLSAREVNLTAEEMLQMYNENLTSDQLKPIQLSFEKSLFDFNQNLNQVKVAQWPESRKTKGFGIHYNLSEMSESIEMMHLVLASRYVTETASSFVNSSLVTPGKCRTKRKILQSPGRRLSHLARRRTIFSSANVQMIKPSTSTDRQIVLKSKKNDKKSVRFAKTTTTPGKRSSAKKSTGSQNKRKDLISIKPTATRETSKRALFQSPNIVPEKKADVFSKEISEKIDKSKRALFSPDNNENKRKREAGDTPVFGKTSRFSLQDCIPSTSLSNRNKIVRSISFQVGNTYSQRSFSQNVLPRTKSDILGSQKELSLHHKQKLLWAVATVLREKNIASSHPDYKKYALSLSRVVKTIFITYTDTTITSTSERMKKIASMYVRDIIKGACLDDILEAEKARQEKLSSTGRGINQSVRNFTNTGAIQDENQATVRSHALVSKPSVGHLGTALKENIDILARQRSSIQKSFNQENSSTSPFFKNHMTSNSFNEGKINGSRNDSLKIKRQIKFDN